MLPQLLANGLLTGAAIALSAVGFTLLYDGGKFFAFTFGAIYTWSAYAFLSLAGRFPWTVALPGGILVGAALGGTLELLLFRPLRHRSASPLTSMLASIGAYTVLQNVVSLVYGDVTRTARGVEIETVLSFGSAHLTVRQVTIIVIALLTSLGIAFFLHASRLGAQLRAVACDRELARIVGVDVDRVILLSTVLGSALGGLAGVLVSLDTDLAPTMGFPALLLAVVAAIVGGVGIVSGAILAGLLLGLAEQLSVWHLPTQWREAAIFVILLLFLFFRPQGLLARS